MDRYTLYARLLLRYVAGGLFGADIANILAGDPEVISLIALGLAAGVEAMYAYAKRKGWET